MRKISLWCKWQAFILKGLSAFTPKLLRSVTYQKKNLDFWFLKITSIHVARVPYKNATNKETGVAILTPDGNDL